MLLYIDLLPNTCYTYTVLIYTDWGTTPENSVSHNSSDSVSEAVKNLTPNPMCAGQLMIDIDRK